MLTRSERLRKMPEAVRELDRASTEWWIKTATDIEEAALREYVGYSYTYMNAYARGMKVKGITEGNIEKYEALKRAAGGFPAIPRGMLLYRGGNEYLMGAELKDDVLRIFKGEMAEDALIGRQFMSASFLSTSYNKVHALNFTKGKTWPVFLTFRVIPGARALSISDAVEGATHRNEKEILFPPNSCIMTIRDVRLDSREGKKMFVDVDLQEISRS